MALSLDVATLISICIESVLYGIYVVFFSTCIYVLVQKRKMGQGHSQLLLVVSVVMFMLATMHIVSDLIRVLKAFIFHQGSTAKYLGAINVNPYLMKTLAYQLQTIIGDGFMLYRLSWIWHGDKRVTIPVLACFMTSVGIAVTVFVLFATAPSSEFVFTAKLQHIITSFFALTLFTNLSCTLLIAGRIWWANKAIIEHTPASIKARTIMPAAVLIIESGAIYSVMLILLLATYVCSSYAQYFFIDAACHVIGIVFSMIIVRIGLGLSLSQAETEVVAVSTLLIAPRTGRSTILQSSVLPDSLSTHAESHPIPTLKVKVTQETRTFRPTVEEANNDGKPLGLESGHQAFASSMVG